MATPDLPRMGHMATPVPAREPMRKRCFLGQGIGPSRARRNDPPWGSSQSTRDTPHGLDLLSPCVAAQADTHADGHLIRVGFGRHKSPVGRAHGPLGIG
jgi:hypothetical protein